MTLNICQVYACRPVILRALGKLDEKHSAAYDAPELWTKVLWVLHTSYLQTMTIWTQIIGISVCETLLD